MLGIEYFVECIDRMLFLTYMKNVLDISEYKNCIACQTQTYTMKPAEESKRGDKLSNV